MGYDPNIVANQVVCAITERLTEDVSDKELEKLVEIELGDNVDPVVVERVYRQVDQILQLREVAVVGKNKRQA